MQGLLSECEDLFGTNNLYEVLNIKKDAKENEVKRAYHKLSLKVHPDRVQDEKRKADATKKFQAMGKAYSILSDKEKRAIYDETGEVDDENDISEDGDWNEYWRILFKKISVEDILEFEEKYKGSKEELDDLRNIYKEYEGDMDDIMDNMMCSTIEDEDRYRELIQKMIKDKEVPAYSNFTKEKKSKKQERKKRAKEEAAEAEQAKKELGLDGDSSLRNMIMQRHAAREKEMDNFFAHLEAKYAEPEKKKSKKGKGKAK